jgi:hypothetical protein
MMHYGVLIVGVMGLVNTEILLVEVLENGDV